MPDLRAHKRDHQSGLLPLPRPGPEALRAQHKSKRGDSDVRGRLRRDRDHSLRLDCEPR